MQRLSFSYSACAAFSGAAILLGWLATELSADNPRGGEIIVQANQPALDEPASGFNSTRRNTFSADDQPQPSDTFRPGENGPDQDELAVLLAQLRQITEKRFRLLNRSGLRREIAIQQRKLEDLESERKLRRLSLDLEQLIEDYPCSLAAERARQMLQAGKISPPPGSIPPIPGMEVAPSPPHSDVPFKPEDPFRRGRGRDLEPAQPTPEDSPAPPSTSD